MDVNPGMFDAQGRARSDYFVSDGLHLKDKAYTEVWKPLVTEKLAPIWDRIHAKAS